MICKIKIWKVENVPVPSFPNAINEWVLYCTNISLVKFIQSHLRNFFTFLFYQIPALVLRFVSKRRFKANTVFSYVSFLFSTKSSPTESIKESDQSDVLFTCQSFLYNPCSKTSIIRYFFLKKFSLNFYCEEIHVHVHTIAVCLYTPNHVVL